MPVSLNVFFNRREVDDLLHKLANSGPGIRKVAAHAAARRTQDHFTKLAGERHRSGAFNFYASAARQTTGRVQGNDVIISVDHTGIGLRYFGGTVRPGAGKKYLTIPADSAAHGKTAREFGNTLFFFRSRKTGAAGLAKRGEKNLRVMFWLVKKTDHTPDPTVLPTEQEYFDAVEPVVIAELERLNNG